MNKIGVSKESLKVFKTKLNEAFKSFRKRGLLARQNYTCCTGCGGYAMAEYASEILRRGGHKRLITGCVFYHYQDSQKFHETGNVFLRYGTIGTSEFGDVGLDSRSVGEIVVQVLSEHGIKNEWDGSPHSCILVKFVE